MFLKCALIFRIYYKILQDGRVTIPKYIRDTLGLKEGDIAEAKLEDGRIVITPNLYKKKTSKLSSKRTKASDWHKLQRVMDSVHEKNKGVSEAEVSADIQFRFDEDDDR